MSTLKSASIVVSVRPPRRRKTARRGAKRTKPKQVPITRLKKQLEALQKQIVIKLYGRDCFTCPAKDLQGSNCQLGHVPWPRSILSVQAKFDYRFTRIQDMPCNIHRGGMGAAALKRMQDEGIDTEGMWQESQAQKGKVVPRIWFEEKITLYKELVDNSD